VQKAKRHGYVILWTAYLVTKTHTKMKLKKEHEAYKKLKPPFWGGFVTPSTHCRWAFGKNIVNFRSKVRSYFYWYI